MAINSIKFVPLCQMTDEDWNILDWDLLRNKAKNRIAAMIIAGVLLGFYHVNVTVPRQAPDPDAEFQGQIEDEFPEESRGRGKAKSDYYWPGDGGGELASDEADWFRYEADDDFLTEEVEQVDDMMFELGALPLTYLVALVIALVASVEATGLSDCEKDRLKELQDKADERRLSNNEYLLLAMLIYRVWGPLRLEEALDKIDQEMERERARS